MRWKYRMPFIEVCAALMALCKFFSLPRLLELRRCPCPGGSRCCHFLKYSREVMGPLTIKVDVVSMVIFCLAWPDKVRVTREGILVSFLESLLPFSWMLFHVSSSVAPLSSCDGPLGGGVLLVRWIMQVLPGHAWHRNFCWEWGREHLCLHQHCSAIRIGQW